MPMHQDPLLVKVFGAKKQVSQARKSNCILQYSGYLLLAPKSSYIDGSLQGLLQWHRNNLTIIPVPVEQPRRIRVNTSLKSTKNDQFHYKTKPSKSHKNIPFCWTNEYLKCASTLMIMAYIKPSWYLYSAPLHSMDDIKPLPAKNQMKLTNEYQSSSCEGSLCVTMAI